MSRWGAAVFITGSRCRPGGPLQEGVILRGMSEEIRTGTHRQSFSDCGSCAYARLTLHEVLPRPSPVELAAYQEFTHLGMVGVLHGDQRHIEPMLQGKFPNPWRIIIGH